MKTYTAAICDDEVAVLPYISSAITNVFLQHNIKLELTPYSSSDILWHDICLGITYDFFFLDIDIPNCSGIDLAKKIRQIQSETPIIFVSAKEELVFKTFQVTPTAFIRKDFFQDDLDSAAAVLYRNFFQEEEKFCILTDSLGHATRVNLNQILYLQAMDKYVNIVMIHETLLIRQTLSVLEEILHPFSFIRIHRGYLVNHRYIYKLEKRKVFLDNLKTLPISRYRMAEVQKLFCLYSE